MIRLRASHPAWSAGAAAPNPWPPGSYLYAHWEASMASRALLRQLATVLGLYWLVDWLAARLRW